MIAQHPLASQLAVGKHPGLKEPRLLAGLDGQNWVVWLEQRPQENGRTTALIRRFDSPADTTEELTSAPNNLRSRVHDYGGGVLATAVLGDRLILVWVEDGDHCLWRQDWWLPHASNDTPTALHQPLRLTAPGPGHLADGLLDPKRHRWIGVREIDGRDQLVSTGLDGLNQQPTVLHQPSDFCGYACLSPDGDQLAWVEWQQPAMPWDSSQLWWAPITPDGSLGSTRQLAGGRGISVFQPQWLPTGDLMVAEDSSGWWNLMIGTPSANPDTSAWRHPWPMQAETAMPQWIYGMSTSAWDGERVLAAVCQEGCWRLDRLGLDGSVETLSQPFDDLAGLSALNGEAIVVASNSTTAAGLLELKLNSAMPSSWCHQTARPAVLSEDAISVAKPLWFSGHAGRPTHAWYYPPSHGRSDAAPLLVKSHSGPTAMARRGLNLSIQYWTSRGWGVVDVNYGGSTGFGRAYRERLQGGWGVVDVEDCAAAARALIDAGQAHPEQIAIEGGSAGGFTTLACLCFTDVFRVGACRYAVCDLMAMATETHRFEARYLDGLVGRWPEERSRYEARSPLLHAEKISCPVLFFQGMKDRVVPPEQTERMASALRSNALPVEVCLFEEEGHGFRSSEVQIQVLEQTEAFFRHHLGLA